MSTLPTRPHADTPTRRDHFQQMHARRRRCRARSCALRVHENDPPLSRVATCRITWANPHQACGLQCMRTRRGLIAARHCISHPPPPNFSPQKSSGWTTTTATIGITALSEARTDNIQKPSRDGAFPFLGAIRSWSGVLAQLLVIRRPYPRAGLNPSPSTFRFMILSHEESESRGLEAQHSN